MVLNLIINYLKNNKLLICIYIFTFFCTLFFYIFITIYVLVALSVYFLFKRNYKNIVLVWVFFFFTWYSGFTLLLVGYEGKILIGGKYTGKILTYLGPILSTYPYLANFCIDTIIFFHLLSEYFGFVFYIPSIFKGVLAILKFFLGGGKGGKGSAGCSPEDKTKKSRSPDVSPDPSPMSSPTTDFNFKESFFSKLKSSSEVIPKSRDEHGDEMLGIIDKRRGWVKSYNPLDWESRRFSKDKGLFCMDFMMPISRFRGTRLKGCLDVEGSELLNLLDSLSDFKKKK